MRLCAILLFLISLSAAQSPEAAALAAWRDYDYPQAEKLYRDAIAHDVTSATAQAGLIRSLLDEHKLADARRAADAALKLFPDSAAVTAANGDVLYREGDIPLADAAFQRAIALDEHLARGWYGEARIAHIEARYRTAIENINQAHELDPDDPEIYQFWASRLPRAERRKALEHLVDHPGHMDAAHLSSLQSGLAWLIVLGNKNAWELVSPAETAKIKLESVSNTPIGFSAPSRTTGVAIKVQLNNKKTVQLMLDSGASGIVLNRGAADKAGVKQIYDTVSKGIGDEKDAAGYLGWLHSLKIGSIEFQNVPVTVLDTRFPPECDGLIGLNVFEHFLITLDIRHSSLELAKLPPLPDDNKAADGSWDRYVAPEMQDYHSILHLGAHILIPTRVDDKPERLFLLDTGAFDTQVDTNYVDPSKLSTLADIPMHGISGRVDAVVATNVRIQFGPFVQNNFRMLALNLEKFSEGDGIGIKGLLGFPLLAQFRLSIDYRDGLMKFDYLSKK